MAKNPLELSEYTLTISDKVYCAMRIPDGTVSTINNRLASRMKVAKGDEVREVLVLGKNLIERLLKEPDRYVCHEESCHPCKHYQDFVKRLDEKGKR